MIVSAIQCNACKDIVFSRAREDRRTCGCGAVGMTGGFRHTETFTEDDGSFEKLEVNIKAKNNTVLFYDWYNGKDKYGLVKTPAKSKKAAKKKAPAKKKAAKKKAAKKKAAKKTAKKAPAKKKAPVKKKAKKKAAKKAAKKKAPAKKKSKKKTTARRR